MFTLGEELPVTIIKKEAAFSLLKIIFNNIAIYCFL